MRILRIAIFLLTFGIAIPAVAQTVPVTADGDHSRLEIAGTFQNLNVANQNLPGTNVSVNVKAASFGRIRLGVVGDASYHYDTGVIGSSVRTDRYMFLGGAQVSYNATNRFAFFGRTLYGATRFNVIGGCNPDFTRATVSFGGGADVSLNDRFAIRAAQIEARYLDERGARYTIVGSGIVIKLF